MENKKQPNKSSMRSHWFDHVRKTRKRLSKGKDVCSHRRAMAEASTTWGVEKAKIQKKVAREARKVAKEKMKLEKVTTQ